MRSLTVTQLKFEMRARDLDSTGLKAVLLTCIIAALVIEDTEPNFNEQDTVLDGESNDVDEPTPPCQKRC